MSRLLRRPTMSLMGRFLEVRAAFAVFVLVLVYFNPPGMVAVFFLAAVLHELSHLAVLLLLNVRVRAIRLGFADAQIVTGIMSDSAQVASALAGPAMNLVCFALFRTRFCDFAAMSLLLGVFNLLPLIPLDGGRAVLALLRRALPQKMAYGAAIALGVICCVVLMVLSWQIRTGSILPFWISILFFFRMCAAVRQEIAVAFA